MRSGLSNETEHNSESTSHQVQPTSEHQVQPTSEHQVQHTSEHQVQPTSERPSSPFCFPQERSLSASEEDPDSLINDLANNIVTYCKENKVNDPVEILRYFQKVMVEGRALRIQESGRMEEGETNFILVDRLNILETALEEVKSLTNLRKTLEVQFYGEVSFTGKCNILPFNL